MKINIPKFVVMTTVFLLLCTGCAQRKGEGKKEIVWAFWGAPQVTDIYQQIVDEFEKKYPDIKVQLMQIPGAAYAEKTQTMVAGGAGPDIIWLGEDKIAGFVKRGALLGLNKYVEEDKAFQLEDFYPAVVETYRYAGTLYGVPKGINTVVMFYNKALFDQEGIPYPEENWDWKDFLEKAKRLTRDTDGDGRIDQYGFGWDYWFWLLLVWQNGGEVIDEKSNKCVIDSPETIAALQFYKDLFTKHQVMPKPYKVGAGELEIWQMFKMGRLAMFPEAHWAIFQFRQQKNFDWDIVPLPKGKKRVTILSSGCFSITKQSKHPDAAWKFISYVTRLPAAEKYFRTLGEEMSPRSSLAHIQDEPDKPPEHHYFLFEAIEYSHRLPTRYPNYQEIEDVINLGLEVAWVGRETVAEACAKIKIRVNKLLEE